MTQDRAEIVEAMARVLLGSVNAPEQEIYRVAVDLADIALKAAAEIAYEKAADQSDWPEGPESYQSGYTVGAQHTARAILALTSEGVKNA